MGGQLRASFPNKCVFFLLELGSHLHYGDFDTKDGKTLYFLHCSRSTCFVLGTRPRIGLVGGPHF